MRLDQVPASWSHDQLGHLLAQPIGLALGRVEGERPAHGVDERGLPTDDVRPRRRQRVLEVGHEDARPGVQRVDHHLGLGRSGDLDAPVVEVGRCRGHGPVGLADLVGRSQEVQPLPGIQRRLTLVAAMQQVQTQRPEPALEVRDERERLRREDAVGAGDGWTGDLDAGRGCWRRGLSSHQDTWLRRTVASMRPCGSVVEM